MSQSPSPPPLPAGQQARPPLIPAWDLLRRNRHVTVPMAVPAGFIAAGAVLAAEPSAAAPTAAGAGMLAAAVWWAAPHKWDRPIERWYARASVLAAGGWLTTVAFMGLRLPELIATGPLALAWGIPWWWHKRPRKQHGHIVAEWDAWWAHYAPIWQVTGSHVVDVTTAGVIDTLTVQLLPGRQHAKQIEDIRPLIESALHGHVQAGMTRVEVVKGNPSQALVHLKRENPHDREVEWDESLAPTSVTELMPIAHGEGGEWICVPMLENWFIIGRKRSGKSNELSAMLASITGCKDARPPWIIDLKGGRSARPWAECADWIAITITEARLLLAAAVAELRARAEHCYTGVEQNVPTEEVPALFVVVDEAHGVLSNMSGDAQCQRDAAIVASEGGAVNVYLIVMTQHGALHESVGTEQIRANLPARMCFAVSEASHGQFALEDWAKLDAAKLENQGEFYYRIAHDQASAPARGPHMPHALVREIAARNAEIDRPPLVLYCGNQVACKVKDGDSVRDVLWQDVYGSRHDRLPASFRRAGSPAATTPPETPMPAQETMPEPPWAKRLQEIEDEVASIPDLPAPPPIDPALLADAMTRKKLLWARLLQDAPPTGIKPSQLEAGSGLGRTWTHQQLGALVGARVITKLATGRYAPASGQDVWAGLERIKEAGVRHAEQARQLVGA